MPAYSKLTQFFLLLFFQATIEGSKPGVEQTKVVAQHAQMEKLNRLEREYLVLTHTQSKAEVRTRMDPSVPSLALLKPE